ncbi:MAG: hypothetical protein AAGI22_29595 [Planctomycetota bacterium]
MAPLATLEEVVGLYSNGDNLHPGVPENEIERLHLGEGEQHALVSFLEALTDTEFDHDVPDPAPRRSRSRRDAGPVETLHPAGIAGRPVSRDGTSGGSRGSMAT